MSFSTRLFQCRKRLHLTQADLAEIIGVARSTVHCWEDVTQEHIPRTRTMEKLANSLGVEVSWLRFGDTKNNQPKDYIFKDVQADSIRAVPLLDVSEVTGFLKLKQHILRKGAFNMTEQEIEQTKFYIMMTDESMTSTHDVFRSIVKGEIMRIDPAMKEGIKSGDIVLVRYGKTDDMRARMYQKDGDDEMLFALNEGFKNRAIDDGVLIIGKVISTYRLK